jgi:hypothetical protein
LAFGLSRMDEIASLFQHVGKINGCNPNKIRPHPFLASRPSRFRKTSRFNNVS